MTFLVLFLPPALPGAAESYKRFKPVVITPAHAFIDTCRCACVIWTLLGICSVLYKAVYSFFVLFHHAGIKSAASRKPHATMEPDDESLGSSPDVNMRSQYGIMSSGSFSMK